MIREREEVVRAPVNCPDKSVYARHALMALTSNLNKRTSWGVQVSARRVYMSKETFDTLASHGEPHGFLVRTFRRVMCGRLGRVCGYLVYEDKMEFGSVHIEYCKSETECDSYNGIAACQIFLPGYSK